MSSYKAGTGDQPLLNKARSGVGGRGLEDCMEGWMHPASQPGLEELTAPLGAGGVWEKENNPQLGLVRRRQLCSISLLSGQLC